MATSSSDPERHRPSARRLVAWLLAAAVACAPALAHAEPSAGDLATARSALREGLTLREKGEHQAALARFTTAWDLVQTPVTGFELGKAHMLVGHVLQAHELFKKVARMPAAVEESTRSASAREEAERLATELEPRIPTLRIRLVLPPHATAVVRVDDDPITTTGAVTPRAVDPGKHVLAAKAGDGPEQHVTIEIAEGETRDVDLAPQWIEPKPAPAAKAERVVYVRQTNPFVFVGFGLSGVAFTLATVATIAFVDAKDRAESLCGKAYCSPSVKEGELREAGTWGVVAAVTGGATIAFAAVGAYSLTKPVTEKVVGKSVTPFVGLGSVGVEGRF